MRCSVDRDATCRAASRLCMKRGFSVMCVTFLVNAEIVIVYDGFHIMLAYCRDCFVGGISTASYAYALSLRVYDAHDVTFLKVSFNLSDTHHEQTYGLVASASAALALMCTSPLAKLWLCASHFLMPDTGWLTGRNSV